MDTTVALFFSLGIVLSPANETTVPSAPAGSADKVVAQQLAKPGKQTTKRHELIKNRIQITNQWLANQRKQRRDAAQKLQLTQLSANSQSCGADWKLT